MLNRNALLLADGDYHRLAELIYNSRSENLEALELELDRATVLPSDQMPQDVVRMNSTLIYKDLDSEQVQEVTLVFPWDADIANKKISILAPMGMALIGLSEGQSIKWILPNGKTRWVQVLRIVSQL